MTARESIETLKIRPASVADVDALTELNAQLGYPTSRDILTQRLTSVKSQQEHAVFVGELEDGHIAGWIHVYVRHLLILDLSATLGGLVVDQAHRRTGIGERLLAHAENWARDRGCKVLWLRSGEAREDAHVFYNTIGYRYIKNSRTFEKKL